MCVSFRRKRQKEHVARLSHKFKQHCVAIGANDWVSVESRILHKSCCIYNAFVCKPQCRCNPSTFFCSAKLLQKPPQLVTEVRLETSTVHRAALLLVLLVKLLYSSKQETQAIKNVKTALKPSSS